ncbi:uncharacterized protein LOC128245979 [Mya arenaria]|uniref:uncharacterized protein LOC128245979 n=1 Tax=Mya arenaria TaxID=6604 RepID=UPI0022E83268|nr:uncharacterized protein LOC128245979 [Mya arenaria]
MSGNRLYRVLRDDEYPSQNGISAKDPSAQKDLEEHVDGGSYSMSQFISCSNSLSAAKLFGSKKYGGGPYRIAVLDRDAIANDRRIQVFDISNGGGFSTERAINFARKFQEVVLVGYIPKKYVLEVK